MQTKRIVVAAIIAEVIPVLLLAGAVFVYSAAGGADPRGFAMRTGDWFGPVVGGIMTFFVAFLAVRRRPFALQHGVAIGVCVALLDLGILAVSGAPLRTLFIFSALGRAAAGTLAGLIAQNN